MSDENKRNILYFEASSMKELFEVMQVWQNENKKRLLSLSVEKEGSKLCCIALTNPMYVIITDGGGSGEADVSSSALKVRLSA
jgi:hypothetical protein